MAMHPSAVQLEFNEQPLTHFLAVTCGPHWFILPIRKDLLRTYCVLGAQVEKQMCVSQDRHYPVFRDSITNPHHSLARCTQVLKTKSSSAHTAFVSSAEKDGTL